MRGKKFHAENKEDIYIDIYILLDYLKKLGRKEFTKKKNQQAIKQKKQKQQPIIEKQNYKIIEIENNNVKIPKERQNNKA